MRLLSTLNDSGINLPLGVTLLIKAGADKDGVNNALKILKGGAK